MKCLSIRPFLATVCTALLCIGTSYNYANEETDSSSMTNGQEAWNWSEALGYQQDDSAYLQRIHDDAYYHLVAFSDNGDVIQLHDASKWAVQSSGRRKVLYWVQNDDIFIKPNTAWFSSYRYVLQNRTKNETVEVNLVETPLPMGAYTFRIVNIEPYARLIQLSDNTIWQVDAQDANFPYWQVGHRVLIGVNNTWRTAPLPNAIINVDMHKEPYSLGNFYGYPAGY